MTLYQVEELDHSVDKWMEKWSFIVEKERELTSTAAIIALKQLEQIITYRLEEI